MHASMAAPRVASVSGTCLVRPYTSPRVRGVSIFMHTKFMGLLLAAISTPMINWPGTRRLPDAAGAISCRGLRYTSRPRS